MRGMRKNARPFWYALLIGSDPILDDYGNEVGAKPIYSNPSLLCGNISPSRGSSETELFGLDIAYSNAINPMPIDCEIVETSILWVDSTPDIAEDGSTSTPHDYRVVAIAKSINHKAYAIAKVVVGLA